MLSCFFFIYFFCRAPSNVLYAVSKELACCTTASLCNGIKILTALQPYLTLELLGSKQHNKLLEKRIEFVFCVCVCTATSMCVLCVCVHVITLRARYRVMSISRLLRLGSCFYYQHHSGGGVCVCAL